MPNARFLSKSLTALGFGAVVVALSSCGMFEDPVVKLQEEVRVLKTERIAALDGVKTALDKEIEEQMARGKGETSAVDKAQEAAEDVQDAVADATKEKSALDSLKEAAASVGEAVEKMADQAAGAMNAAVLEGLKQTVEQDCVKSANSELETILPQAKDFYGRADIKSKCESYVKLEDQIAAKEAEIAKLQAQ